MAEQRLFNLCQPSGQIRRTGQRGANLYEGTDDIDAHLDRARTAEDVRRHDRAVLGEGVREQPWVAMFLRTGHNL